MEFVNMLLLLFVFGFILPINTTYQTTGDGKCGSDKSRTTVVYEGYSKIETYPWLGVLCYSSSEKKFSTSVVLVTVQIVIGSAMDIDKLPKNDLRSNSLVYLGRNCSAKGIGVRDYTYHPDFNRASYSALALIQLETLYWMKDLSPICAPPAAEDIEKPQFYAMAQTDDCESSSIKLHKMTYVDRDQCKAYYRRTELDEEKMWPSYTLCARAMTGPECVWSNGVVLTMRQYNKWYLIGFGILGPGCHAPSRFFDYSRYRPWLRSSIERIGSPTVTRISKNHIVLRRSLSNVQRFGPCDPEEIRAELWSDSTVVERYPTYKRQRARYNFTIFANYEYSCVVFRSYHYKRSPHIKEKPYIQLSRWCMSAKPICYTTQMLRVDFKVEIHFRESVKYKVVVYGQEIRVVDRKKLMAHLNSKKPYVPVEKGSNYWDSGKM